ncbi:MAG: cytochrome c [Gemmatimonadaceae bacterium]|nr:cytochrome c [Gemmatimonadaceae bacterium]
MSPSSAARRGALSLLVLGLLAGASAPVGAQAATRAASAGVYTEEQLARGKATHQANCISCHNSIAYKGAAFTQKWGGRSAFEFFQLISTTMPQNEPGVLSPEEYADITAYVLWLNGFPAGTSELAADDALLRRVRIDAATAATSSVTKGLRQRR